jgi:RNA polymerase sigma-70 factor (ECF subfamily)
MRVHETGQSERESQRNADAAAVARVLAGETAAFEEIVRRWQGPLVNMAWRYTRDRGRAEDMAQEAFLRAWRSLAQWRGDAAFSSWLFALAANVYRTELKRYPAPAAGMDEVAEPASLNRTDAALDAHAREERVRRAVLALPEKYRDALVLYYFHEMDLAAAARTLGVNEGTLKAQLARGREQLRKRFPQLRQELDWKEAMG